MPAELLLTTEERQDQRARRAQPMEHDMTSKTEQVANLRKARAERAQMGTKPPKSAGAPQPAPAAKRAPKGAAGPSKAKQSARSSVEHGSKTDMIAKLLTRAAGATTAQILEATGWKAVNVPRQAEAAGLKLKTTKVNGKTVYRAA